MSIDPKWSVGNIVSVATLIGLIISLGYTYGQVVKRLESLEAASQQSNLDSRTLIRVESDVAYIKESIQRIERATSLASLPVSMCPNEKPVLVASHCRTLPMLD